MQWFPYIDWILRSSQDFVLLWVDTQHFNIFFVCQLIEQCLWSAIPQNATWMELQCFPWMWLFSRVTPQGPCSFSLLRRIHALEFAWALCCVLLYKLWKRTELHIYMQNNWWLETNQNMHFTHDIFFEIYMQGRVSLFLIVTLWIFTLKIVNIDSETKYFIHFGSFVRLVVLFLCLKLLIRFVKIHTQAAWVGLWGLSRTKSWSKYLRMIVCMFQASLFKNTANNVLMLCPNYLYFYLHPSPSLDLHSQKAYFYRG